MKIKDQVVSLELAKKLKELGVKQEGLFAFYRKGHYWSGQTEFQPGKETLEENVGDNVDFPHERVAVTFTVAELGEMLPYKLEEKGRATDYETYYYLNTSLCEDNVWETSYCGLGDCGCEKIIVEKTEADSRAKMLIYLIENKLISNF